MSPTIYADPTGQCPACAAVAYGVGAGIVTSLLSELATNGWQFACVDWFNVGLGGLAGAFGGAFLSGFAKGLPAFRGLPYKKALEKYNKVYGNKGKGVETHHGLVEANGLKTASLKHHFLNFKTLPKTTHKRIHGGWGQEGKLPGWLGDFLGTPTWLQAGAGTVFAGALAETFTAEAPCACEN